MLLKFNQLCDFAQLRALNNIRRLSGVLVAEKAIDIFQKRFIVWAKKITPASAVTVHNEGGVLVAEVSFCFNQDQLLQYWYQFYGHSLTQEDIWLKEAIIRVLHGVGFLIARQDGNILSHFYPLPLQKNLKIEGYADVFAQILYPHNLDYQEVVKKYALDYGWSNVQKISFPFQYGLINDIYYGINPRNNQWEIIPFCHLVLNLIKSIEEFCLRISDTIVQPFNDRVIRYLDDWYTSYFLEDKLWHKTAQHLNFNDEGEVCDRLIQQDPSRLLSQISNTTQFISLHQLNPSLFPYTSKKDKKKPHSIE